MCEGIKKNESKGKALAGVNSLIMTKMIRHGSPIGLVRLLNGEAFSWKDRN